MTTVSPLSRRALLAGTASFAVASTVSHADERPARVLQLGFQDDATTLDPHAFNHGPTFTLLAHVYEGLVRRDSRLQVEPALATSWERPEPTLWRFRLRPGVRFHDGIPLSAEDVVFSLRRAMDPLSDMKVFAASIAEVRAPALDSVEIITAFPNSALIQSLPELRVLSKAWAVAHGAEQPADMRVKAESGATRQANGTGPYVVASREPDVRTVLRRNDAWWDKAPSVAEAHFVRIAAPATRIAALLSGVLDFASPVPVQDLDRVRSTSGLKVLQGPDIRTMFLAMDLARAETPHCSVKDANPFRDRRVRQAIYQAIDVEALRARLMRGTVVSTGSMVAPQVSGADPALQPRAYPFDLDAARRLLAEAGYGSGFEVVLDTPNDRYVNDEATCVALGSMLARIGIKVRVNAMAGGRFFQKIGARDTSFCFFGYSPVNLDAWNTLNVVVQTPDGRAGQWNVGGYSNAEVDRLVIAALGELDAGRRNEQMAQALALHKRDIGHIPLWQQGPAWGMKAAVETPLVPDNRVNLALFG